MKDKETRVTLTISRKTVNGLDKNARKVNKSRSKYMAELLTDSVNLNLLEMPANEQAYILFYRKLADLVYENKELFLMEKSPLSILGPDLNSDFESVPYEVHFFTNLKAHLRNCHSLRDYSFFEVFNKESLKNDLSELIGRKNDQTKERIDEYFSNLEEIKSLMKNPEGSIEIWPSKRKIIFYRATAAPGSIIDGENCYRRSNLKNSRCLEWIYAPFEEGDREKLVFGEELGEISEIYHKYITDLALKEPYQGDPVKVIEELEELPKKL